MASNKYFVNLNIDGVETTLELPANLVQTMASSSDYIIHENQSNATTTEVIEEKRREENCSDSISWTHEQVLLLTALYMEHRDKFNNSMYKCHQVWQVIADSMKENGHTVSSIQCDKKFRSLKYRYKVIKDSNSKSGRSRKKWEFYEIMEEIMAGDPCIKPSALLSSSKDTTQTAIQEQNVPSEGPLEPVKKKKKKDNEVINLLQNIQEENSKKLDKCIEATNRLASAAEKRNNILEKLVESLNKHES